MKFSRLILTAKLFNGETATSDISFSDGCTVIVTDKNTRGKSSLINSLALGLGFDDLAKSNVSALVNDTLKYKGEEHRIISANIYLEIKNEHNDFLSIKRNIKPELSNGISVQRTKLEKWTEGESEECYIGSGSYMGNKGFHRLLSEFTNFPLIKVISQDDSVMRLYMEYMFAGIFIEQKRGWADIMSNTPYYGVREPKKTTLSEILGMDYIQNNLLRTTLNLATTKLKASYDERFSSLRQHVNSKHFSLKSIPSDISSETWSPAVFLSFESSNNISLNYLISEKEEALTNLKKPFLNKSELISNRRELEEKLITISEKIASLLSEKKEKDISLANLNMALNRYDQRMVIIKQDLVQNKEEQKIRKLFSHDKWSVKEQCPVCEQGIDESLLSQIKSFPTMSLDENVKYLDEQRKVLEEVIHIEKEDKEKKQAEISYISSEIQNLMKQHSEIQTSLSSAIPSEVMERARQIARLEQETKELKDLKDYTESNFHQLKETYEEYHKKYQVLSGLKTDLSTSDKKIIYEFQTVFRNYLHRLGYNSFETASLNIDYSTFMPRVMLTSRKKIKKMRPDFGSSASDWIRIITAYTLALHACRNNSEKSIHPNVTVFDEPRQQNLDIGDHLKFYDIVNDVCKKGGQVIIAETDKDHLVRAKALSLSMKVIDFKGKYIFSESSA